DAASRHGLIQALAAMRHFSLALFAAIATLPACSRIGGSDSQTYTLYRNSVLDSSMRVHLATFDAADGDKYNQENCQLAQELFQRQKDVATRFWCEKGRFHE